MTVVLLAGLFVDGGAAGAEVAQRVWQPMTLDFAGPVCRETDRDPNPFLDFRLQVTFTAPDGRTCDVPGYFAGDGEGGAEGNVWRVRFSGDQAGEWTYRASFRTGPEVAVSLSPSAGRAVACDGQSGSFELRGADPGGPDFYRWGRLEYVGGHYLKFRNGPYWIRGGTDSPEDLLAYAGFDNTPPSHRYADHEDDWRSGDPDWGDGRGRAIIGALNYLASKHVNSLYFLVMNVGGDGGNVWPWVHVDDPRGSVKNDDLHYDVSKLRQWDMVFEHAQRRGIFLHVVLNEAEKPNKRELDDGELGVERKLYYREIVARFGHHVALQWNLCEEYNIGLDLGHDRVRSFADYLGAVDPYDHPITVHSAKDPVEQLSFTFGDDRFSMTSVQLNQSPIDTLTETLREATRRAGRPLPISMDEFTVDLGQEASYIPVDDAERWRKEKLWPTYLSGGNIEFILGDLLKTESFKTPQRDQLWEYVWYARRFMEENLPFWEMEPNDDMVRGAASILVTQSRGRTTYRIGAQVLAKPDEIYAVYFPDASECGQLDLSSAEGVFLARWFNPRDGRFRGATRETAAGDWIDLQAPPDASGKDWVLLLTRHKPMPN